MSLRTTAMNMPFSDPIHEEQGPEQYHLLRKLAILLLLVGSAALWLFILFDEERLSFGTTVEEIGAGVGLALVAGLGAQLVLSKRNGFFRFVAAMTGNVAGIYLLGFLSAGKYGISKFGWLPKAVDYDGLNLVGIGFAITLFMSLLFRRTKIVVIPEPVQVPSPEREPEIQIEPLDSGNTPRISLPRNSWLGFFPSHSDQRSTGGRIRSARVKPMVPPRRRQHRGRARIQLALVEEHRCPYCLELVSRSDPHGVMECKVCHTLHHKDCWDITGSCQVPHLNT